MKKKLTKSQLKKKADLLFGKLIRSRGKCEMCSETKNLQCAHVIGRRNLHLRYDKQNVLCLCAKCHFLWHQSPRWAISWFKSIFPERDAYLAREEQVIEHSLDYEEVVKRLENDCSQNS